MKAILILLALSSLAFSQDKFDSLKTLKGREYISVTVTKSEPDGLRIIHESGTAKLFFTDLPEEIREKYGYDPEAGAAFKADADAAAAAQERALAAHIAAVRSKEDASEEAAREEAPPAEKAGVGADAARPPSGIRLNAQTTSTSRDTDNKWATSWGSYDKTIYRGRVVRAEITAATSGMAVAECHWIGNTNANRSARAVVKVDRTPLELRGGEKQVIEFGALFAQDLTRYAALGWSDERGAKYYGWVVRIVSEEGKTLAVQGARSPMISLIGK